MYINNKRIFNYKPIKYNWRKIKFYFQWFLFLASASLATFLFLKLLKSKILYALAYFLEIDAKLLFDLLLYSFLGGSSTLVFLVLWLNWDEIQFKMKRKEYRSKLVCRDYYEGYDGLQLKQVISGIAKSGRKLEIDPETGKTIIPGQEDEFIAPRSLATKISYKNGKLDGTFRSFFTNGQLAVELNYIEGKMNGLVTTFYPEGQLRNERRYNNSKLDGIFRAYDEDGKLFFEIEYKNGIQHGIDKTFYKSGTIEYKDLYSNGRMINRKTYDEYGKLKFNQNFAGGATDEAVEELFSKMSQQPSPDS